MSSTGSRSFGHLMNRNRPASCSRDGSRTRLCSRVVTSRFVMACFRVLPMRRSAYTDSKWPLDSGLDSPRSARMRSAKRRNASARPPSPELLTINTSSCTLAPSSERLSRLLHSFSYGTTPSLNNMPQDPGSALASTCKIDGFRCKIWLPQPPLPYQFPSRTTARPHSTPYASHPSATLRAFCTDPASIAPATNTKGNGET
mmetsp:Transcript_48128/g.113998  ORF Transcript_48128/g.113998 Transcript_48128/m.113998 type:complete len:201 (-) Transcript_48128:253-855(-)